MQTLANYTTKIQNEVDDSSARAKNVIERAIEDTYQEILRFTVEHLAGATEEDITATVDQRYVTPDNTYQDLKNVLWKSTLSSSYTELKRMTRDDYYNSYVNRDSSDPTAFYLNASDIYFDVAPSNAGTVKISGVETQDELGTSIIPDRFTQVVLLGSIARFKAYEGLQDAREYFKLYRGPYFEQGKVGGALKTMIDDLTTRQPKSRPKLYGK